ncbi:carbohydrate porin [Sphingomonas mali]|uniref:carbohydrate porin n=1 Tax=Sphingomonas mali TaxID=40682 RepID=UPI0008370F16|nr:carbohydrate porin [Sphingomonas mali]
MAGHSGDGGRGGGNGRGLGEQVVARLPNCLPLEGLVAAGLALVAAPAVANDAPPTFSLSARNTLDGLVVAGVRRDAVLLDKLQLSATIAGDDLGLAGVSVHGQIFRVDGASPSARIGDIQTVDNIDAAPVTRLFEAWVEKKFGNADRSLAVRAGLIDLNADFDSIQTAGLFLNSSHGIGADLSRSGVDGPSIYPVTATGLRMSWLPSKAWTVRVAAFDGVSGDPGHPNALVRERLVGSDGALLIAQVDYHLSDTAKVEAGSWHYTRARSDIGSSGMGRGQGVYVSIEGPLPGAKKWSAWARAGVANGDAQVVDGYLGLGVVRTGTFKGRKDDRVGLAIARASIGEAARTAFNLPQAETSIEASYQWKMGTSFAVQPDVQYVRHPADLARAPSALVFGLRIVATAGFPKQAPADAASDPTVPADGPPGSDADTNP